MSQCISTQHSNKENKNKNKKTNLNLKETESSVSSKTLSPCYGGPPCILARQKLGPVSSKEPFSLPIVATAVLPLAK
jgi:hypothetical protein